MNEAILIIEGSREMRENTAELLELKNYQVLTAEDGSTGFEIAHQYQPNLIICDLTIPDTDGYTYLRLAKENAATCNIPVIFFLDSEPCPDVNNVWMNVAKGYVRKPFTAQDLFAGVASGLSVKTPPVDMRITHVPDDHFPKMKEVHYSSTI
jgi:CRP/FNR family cyclic AMP-dependent transcriptional regulator